MTDTQVFFIAEAGVNHCGDLQMAQDMVEVAAAAGADAIKFQTFNASRLTVKTAPKAEYQKRATGEADSQQTMLSKLELSLHDHQVLFDLCQDKNIEFMSTGFDTQSVDFLITLGIKRIKIPSGEITNLPYLRHVAAAGLPVILSTGMSTMDEVIEAVDCLYHEGLKAHQLTVLHCNTAYPTPFRDVNLNCLKTIRDELAVKVGYSDHTLGDVVAIAAVALGSRVVEKHFTLDRTLPGPDQSTSLHPDELRELITKIRHLELALGDSLKQPTPSEIGNIAVARKSLVANTAIAKGDVFTADNISSKRPGTGISPMQWDNVIGQKATRDYVLDDPIEL